jgi:hypothetical protein
LGFVVVLVAVGEAFAYDLLAQTEGVKELMAGTKTRYHRIIPFVTERICE